MSLKQTFLSGPVNCLWLRETHLRHLSLPEFDSAVLYGNEDCPERVELYSLESPTIHDTPIETYTMDDDGVLKLI